MKHDGSCMNGCYNAICSLVMLKRRTVQRVKAFSDVIDVILHQYRFVSNRMDNYSLIQSCTCMSPKTYIFCWKISKVGSDLSKQFIFNIDTHTEIQVK